MSKFERFDVDLEGKTNSSRWKVWLRRFDLYVEANGITGDMNIIAILWNEAGSGIEEIYEAIRKTDVAKKMRWEIWRHFKAYHRSFWTTEEH